MSALPSSPAPEPPSSADPCLCAVVPAGTTPPVCGGHCSCSVVRNGLEPARCRCYVEPIIDLSGTFGLTECTGFEGVARGAELTAELLERTRDKVLTSELHSYLAADDHAFQQADADRWGAAVEAETALLEAQRKLRIVETQRPTLSRIVHVIVHPDLNGGTDVASAIVTRVHGQVDDGGWLVNLRVWLDGTNHSHEWAPSRTLYADEAAARATLARWQPERLEHPAAYGVSPVAFWPARS